MYDVSKLWYPDGFERNWQMNIHPPKYGIHWFWLNSHFWCVSKWRIPQDPIPQAIWLPYPRIFHVSLALSIKIVKWSRTSRQQICLDLVSKALESLNPYSSPLEIPLDGSIPMKSLIFWCWNHHLSAPNISATCRSRCCPRWCVACGSAWLRASHTWRCMAKSQKPGARMVPYSSWFSWMLILPVISGFPENGGTPIAGWFIMKHPKIKWMFISWKNYNGWWMGTPMSENLHMVIIGFRPIPICPYSYHCWPWLFRWYNPSWKPIYSLDQPLWTINPWKRWQKHLITLQ